jgi:hypothetical protein
MLVQFDGKQQSLIEGVILLNEVVIFDSFVLAPSLVKFRYKQI